MPAKEAKAEIETHQVTTEAKIVLPIHQSFLVYFFSAVFSYFVFIFHSKFFLFSHAFL